MHSAAFLKLQSTGFKKDFAVKNMPDKEFVDKVHLWLATNLVSGKSALKMKSPELKTVVFNYDQSYSQSYETTFGFECSHCQMKMTVIVKKISANKGQVVFRNIRPQAFGSYRIDPSIDEDETILLKKEFEKIVTGIENEIN